MVDPFEALTPSYDVARATARPEGITKPGYYGLPILKRPFWTWEIAAYFFSEGISSGCHILAAVAELTGKRELQSTVRSGRYLSFVFLLPCPPLLIADLGRPERFHHMLRIFKRTSPMNHGAWALSGYGVFSALALLPELPLGRLRRILPGKIAGLLGMPFALTMLSYPGVLLSTTSIPVWAHTHVLGALLACSSMSSAVSALTLCNYNSSTEHIHKVLGRLEDVTSVAEAVAMTAYLSGAGKATRPLLRGKQSKLFLWGALAAGLLAPMLLRRSRVKAIRAGVAPLLTLAGSLALKLSLTYAGQESAMDPELAAHNAPGPSNEPFWGPK